MRGKPLDLDLMLRLAGWRRPRTRKYQPHQGERERMRRLAQLARLGPQEQARLTGAEKAS